MTIEITREGARFRFVCRDDGRGIDFAAVRRNAEARGVAAAALGEEELCELLLAGGISTSTEITTVAGRGVGLDVVREAASLLGGSATVSSTPRGGTVLTLTVPVVRSALDALLVEAGGQVSAIPLRAVRRALRVAPSELARSAEGDAIVLDGRVVPFAPLVRSLGYAPNAAVARKAWSAVVVEARRGVAAIGVDRLLGTEAIVMSPLPEGMPPLTAVAGATLDANGNPRLVVDPDGLVGAVESTSRAPAPEPKARIPVLVIDDSLTTRMLEQSILESAGYEVDLASSAEEGLEMARAKRYALFLVDVEMPGIDGFTFVERTRADPTLGKVPAILVTSRSADEDRRRGAAAGASAYVVKGELDQAELLATIRTLVA
jgi:two-component system chemotaxis sensor kinase CheA